MRSGLVNAAKLSWITRRSSSGLETLSEQDDDNSDNHLVCRATYDWNTMSGSGSELPKPSSSHQGRQQLYRSTSEVPHSNKLHRIHHHPHLHRRDKDEKVDKSFGASLQPSSTYEGPKNEWSTPNCSREGSRRTSIFTSADDNPIIMGSQRERRAVKEGEVKAEKERSALRAAELRKSIHDLSILSNNTTSRLDNTYYSVLEKLSTLNNTIASLKELSATTRHLNDDFVRDSTEVVLDIENQLDAFEEFHEQERKIEALEQRIEAGREKAQTLGYRVEAMKQKIERWERVEGEWQQRTRKRLKILWAVTAVFFVTLAGLIAFQYSPARTQGPGVLHGLNLSNFTFNISEARNMLGNETLPLKRSAIGALEKLRRPPDDELEDDPRLRLFDEL